MASRKMFSVVATAVCLIASPLFAQDTWKLVTADFQSRPVGIVAMDANGVHIATESNDSPSVLSWDNLLELDHPSAANAAGPANKGDFVLYINGGDTLNGDPIAITDDSVAWKHSVLGRIDIPEDRVGAIVRSGQSAAGIDQPRKADVVRMLNGDTTSGVIESVTDSSISIHPTDADASAQISLDKVAAILLADPDPHASPTGRAWRVWLNDGSSLTVPAAKIVEADPTNLAVGFTDQKMFAISLANVSSIEQTNGPVRWLSAISPTETIYHPYFDENFPPQFDHPVDDPTASIRSKFPAFRHGIGVHSYTRLAYAVPDGFTAFRTQFAVEPIATSEMTKADLHVRIFADGKIVAEVPHVRFGPAAPPMMVDLTGKKEIALEVDFGDNLNAQGRFVWLDSAFTKTSPSDK